MHRFTTSLATLFVGGGGHAQYWPSHWDLNPVVEGSGGTLAGNADAWQHGDEAWQRGDWQNFAEQHPVPSPGDHTEDDDHKRVARVPAIAESQVKASVEATTLIPAKAYRQVHHSVRRTIGAIDKPLTRTDGEEAIKSLNPRNQRFHHRHRCYRQIEPVEEVQRSADGHSFNWDYFISRSIARGPSGLRQIAVLPNINSYIAAIGACEKAQQRQQALDHYGVMQQTPVLPDFIFYIATISDCEKGQQWQQDLGHLAAMQRTAILPKVISYNAIFSACGKGQQWQQALGLFAVMQKTTVLPEVISYTVTDSACEKGQQWQQASGLLTVMHQSTVLLDVISYIASFIACGKGQRSQQALGRLAVIQQTIVLPNVTSYNVTISACDKDQQWQQALSLLAVIQQTYVLPAVISHNADTDQCTVSAS
mgnify:CR=1 FL=1